MMSDFTAYVERRKLLTMLLQTQLERLCVTSKFKSPEDAIDVKLRNDSQLSIDSWYFKTDTFNAEHTLSNWRRLSFGVSRREILSQVVDENWDIVLDYNSAISLED